MGKEGENGPVGAHLLSNSAVGMDTALACYGDEFVGGGDGVRCDVRVCGRRGVEGGGGGVDDGAGGGHGGGRKRGVWCWVADSSVSVSVLIEEIFGGLVREGRGKS